jgi:glutamine amidotransferase
VSRKKKIAIIDVTGNNLTSLVNAIHRLGFDCVLTHSDEQIMNASHVILPGVGAAPIAMQALHDYQLVKLIQQLQQPLLGICLGMQLLFERSEEGEVDGLGLIKGDVQQIPAMTGFPVPHMGWNCLHWCQDSLLQKGLGLASHVYFVHGFAVKVGEYTVASSQYSIDFSAIVQKNNIYGMQFHPEKSAETGLKLLKNFLTLEEVC